METKKPDNQNIVINLFKLKGAGVMNIQGKTEKKKCVIIPIEDNGLFSNDNGVFLDIIAFGVEPNEYGNTHLVKKSLSKAERESMTDEQQREMPILGNVRSIKKTSVADAADSRPTLMPEDDDYLSF